LREVGTTNKKDSERGDSSETNDVIATDRTGPIHSLSVTEALREVGATNMEDSESGVIAPAQAGPTRRFILNKKLREAGATNKESEYGGGGEEYLSARRGSSPYSFSEDSTIGRNYETINIIAPSGTLNVLVDSPLNRGPAIVIIIEDNSSIADQIRLGDVVVAVDDQYVREMSAPNVSQLLASKSRNLERKITVHREVGAASKDDGGDAGGEEVCDTLSTLSDDVSMRSLGSTSTTN